MQTTFETKVLSELSWIHSKLEEHDRKFDVINTRFIGVENRLSQVENHLIVMEKRLDGFITRDELLEILGGFVTRDEFLEAIDHIMLRLERIEQELTFAKATFRRQQEETSKIKHHLKLA